MLRQNPGLVQWSPACGLYPDMGIVLPVYRISGIDYR